jgi:hypothetical protein
LSRETEQPNWAVRVVGRGHQVALLVAHAAVLALAALIGVAWAGFTRAWHLLLHPSLPWLAVRSPRK